MKTDILKRMDDLRFKENSSRKEGSNAETLLALHIEYKALEEEVRK